MVLDPVSAAATSAIIYQSAIGSTAALGTTTMIITRSNAISSWAWRKIHGSGTYRVIFGNTCPRPYEYRLLQYLASQAARVGVRFLQSYSFRTTSGGSIQSIDIPTKSFLLEKVDRRGTHIYVQPLITSSGQVGGYEFWSYSWFRWDHRLKYKRMITHINKIMKPAQTFNTSPVQKQAQAQTNSAGAGTGIGGSTSRARARVRQRQRLVPMNMS